MFLSQEKDLFVLIKSSVPSVAKKRLKDIILDFGVPLFRWEFLRISNKESKKLLDAYELNTVYAHE
jgi:hypothetical protein